MPGVRRRNLDPIVPAGSAYRPELDILRFGAFLLVFVHHVLPRGPEEFGSAIVLGTRDLLASLVNMCGFGLSLFFVISGFLITDVLLREKSATGRVHLKMFYVRRILRIWPLYFVVISIGFLFLTLRPSDSDAWMLTLYLLLIGNWFFAAGQWSVNPATPLWSISIEEQFYLFWPAIIKCSSSRSVYAFCILIFLVSVGVEAWLGHTHRAVDTTIWTNSFVQFPNFAAGAALALFLDGKSLRFDAGIRLALLALGGGLWFVAVHSLSAKAVCDAPGGLSVILGSMASLAGSVLVFAACLGAPLQKHTGLIYLGKISFGLYAYHLLFILIATVLSKTFHSSLDPAVQKCIFSILSIVPTIITASLSYNMIETPFLRLKTRFSPIGPGTMVGLTSTPA